MTARGAHPRSRGEHRLQILHPSVYVGSSPLARGAPRMVLQMSGANGLIPARAGSTHRGSPQAQQLWAHPRSRGEHLRLVRLFGAR